MRCEPADRRTARSSLQVDRGGAEPSVLITGGAGFIGCNLADRLLQAGTAVTVFDDLSRPGAQRNLDWLRARHARLLRVEIGDIRDAGAVAVAVMRASQVFHFAAQVAVTTSLTDPRADFDVNAVGTLNVLEGLRALGEPPPLVFTSTNKVYGGLSDVPLRDAGLGYEPENAGLRAFGMSEQRPLDFRSPYGCSKGTADQYVLDYARSFGLDAAVLRMSCIYGPRQFGTEDQGWVAHFLIRALRGEPIRVYGDGKQVRDLLFIDDLLDALDLAMAHMPRLRGEAFNVGGGPGNSVSVLEVVERIGALRGARVPLVLEGWRPGDQRFYVSDTRLFTSLTGWAPRVGPAEGIARLAAWLGDELAGQEVRLHVARQLT